MELPAQMTFRGAVQTHLSGNWIAVTMRQATAFILLFAAILLPKVADAQVVTINQSFNGTTAPGWVLGGTGYTPILTAAQGIDPNGSGWLRLTSNGGNQATYAYDSTAFNAANATIAAQFSYASYNGTGADGITFFLADASKTFSVGAYGGSLGYAQKTAAGGGGADINGMNGGYIGLGVDEYGNYANPTEGRVGGIGASPNAISVRGPGQGLTGYNYLGGTGSLGTSLAFPGSTTRPTGVNTRTVEIVITATNQMTVYLQAGTGAPFVPLYTIDLSGYARPDQLVMGFTGSTGGSTDIHEIQNVSLSSVAANLWTNAAGTNTWGTTFANWNGTVAPATGADILLDNTYVNGAQTIDVGQNRIVRSVQIDAPFSYALNDGSLEFNNEGIIGPSGILVSQTHGAAAQTINSNLIADNAIEIRNGTTAGLSLTGTLATNGNTVTVDGSGSTTLSGVISGAGSIVKNDAGNATFSGANTYAGGTTLNAGTLTADNNSALGTGALTLNGGTLASDNNNTVGNTITLQGNASLSNIITSGTLTQTSGSYTVTMSNATPSGTVNLSNNNTGRTLTTEVDSGTSTISGIIQNGGTGAGNLAKTGAGTLVLSGANTYSGATTISAGTLQLGASNVLADSSSLNIGVTGNLNLNGFSDKVGNLTAAGGATLDFGPQTGANTFVFGTYTAPTSGVLVVNDWQQTIDTLATTVTGQNVSTIYLAGYGIAQEATVTSSTLYGNAYLLTPVAQTGIVWDGSSSSNWNTGTNWTGNAKPGTTQIAVFNSTGSGRPNVNLNGSNTIAGLKFDTTAPSYTITGSNTLTLSGTVPYIQQKSSSGQTLAFSTLNLGNNTVADVSGSGNLTISAALTGTSNLIKDGTGSGKLILSGNSSTYTGNIFVNNGVLQITANNALGSSTTGSSTIYGGAALEINGTAIASAENISLQGDGIGGGGAIRSLAGTNTLSGTLTLTADARINADAGTLTLSNSVTSSNNSNLTLGGNGNIVVSGTISNGSGTVTKDGSGSVTLSGTSANSFSGQTTVNSGTLNLSKAANTTAIAGNLTVNGGTINENASGQIASTSTLAVNGGTFALTGGSSNTFNTVNTATGGTISLSSGSTLTINGAGNSTINGGIAGAGALNTQGTGSVTLANNNTYSGGSTLASVVTALNSGSLGTGAVTVNSGGNLQVQGGINLANNFTLNSPGTTANDGAIQNVAGNNAISGAIALAGNSRIQSDSGALALSGGVSLGGSTLNVGGPGNTSISGVVAGTGGMAKDGAGTLTLSAANTYSGATAINAGTLAVGTNNALSSATAVTIGSGATFNLNNYADTVGSIAGSGTLNIGSGTLIAGANNTSTTFSGSFLDGAAGTFEKTGTGTLTFGAGMNYSTGNLVLNSGTLNLGGFTSTFSSLSVTANSTLDFSGTSILNLSSLAVNSGVTLTITNWADTVDYFYSLVNPGSANLGRIVFTGFTAGDTKWQSFDHEVTPVPEPSAYGAAFMLLGLSAGVWWRRHRHSRVSSR
jgi:autotransporter-associated beta strand protein